MVCSDLDGTLLNNKSDISTENLLAIEQLAKRGIYFVPSTGRAFSELPAKIKNSPAIRYMICSNGAMVMDRKTNLNRLTCMSNQTVCKIFAILHDYQTHISVRQGGNCVADAAYQDEKWLDHYNVCQAHRDVLRDYAVFRSDFAEFCAKTDEVEVISVFLPSDAELVDCRKRIDQIGGLRITSVSEGNLEIMNIKAGKGNALRDLANMLGIDPQDTISIGDSDNDSSITEAAGLGLAVSNACDGLKAIADEIICSNEEHAIAYVLAHYL